MDPRKQVNPIDVIEAAYDLDVDDRAWLVRLTHLVRPLLDDGLGVMAYPFDIHVPVETWFAGSVIEDIEEFVLPLVAAMQQRSPSVTHAFHQLPDVLLTMRDTQARTGLEPPAQLEELFARIGACDGASLRTVEPGGRGVIFTSARREVRPYDERTRRVWRQVAAHIAAGRRLRAALARGAGQVEAVLTPSARVEHVEGRATSVTAREALRAAVRLQEHARGWARQDQPEAAAGAWTALVSGQWSLVDQYERDGRRYLVARRNDLGLRDPRALTAREHAIVRLAALGKANKLIAYELGLAESTVGTHLASAMRKLGARSRVELVGLIAQLDDGP
ncbi:MAG TPA: helix-turn-helix transcriptional regulator [Kofleriaceae bacterium]|jgi:DNA-binding CsgD family transcriptional regulator|nr:helix-turn-helix transcriptional regulator [Kofleriaceae bacterium]